MYIVREEGLDMKKYKLINKIKYYTPIFGACTLWFLICIGILVG